MSPPTFSATLLVAQTLAILLLIQMPSRAGADDASIGHADRLAAPGEPVITLITRTPDDTVDYEGTAAPFDFVALTDVDATFLVTQADPDGVWAIRQPNARFDTDRLRPLAFSMIQQWQQGDLVPLNAEGPWITLRRMDKPQKTPQVLYSLDPKQFPSAYKPRPRPERPLIVPRYKLGAIRGSARIIGGRWQLDLNPVTTAGPEQPDLAAQTVIFATNREPIEVEREMRGIPQRSTTFGSVSGALSIGSAAIINGDAFGEIEISSAGKPPAIGLPELLPPVKTDVSVFIHGCCTSFDSSLLAIGRLAHQLRLTSLPVLFSWPTRGTTIGYTGDRDTAVSSRSALTAFLGQLATIDTVDHIDVLAHSLGNQLLLETLRDLAREPTDTATLVKTKLRHIVFASPDVERQAFKTLINESCVCGLTRTLYVSGIDWALYLQTKLFSGLPRAGYVSKDGPLVMPGLDTIDVSNANSRIFTWAHSAFSDELPVLNDLAIILLRGTRPPDQRQPIFREEKMPDGGKYWYFPKL